VRALATDAVETWYLPVGDHSSHPWAEYKDLLSRDEKERASRFVRPSDRRHYTAAHALLRVMLSSFAEVSAGLWRFRLGPQGRPEVEPGLSALPLRFSLSHTDGLVAAAVTLHRAVGLDIEAVDRRVHDMSGVVRFFAPEEIRVLDACAPQRRGRAFFETWTMKEAFVKATGLGLSLPLDRFAVALDPPRLLFAPAEWAPSAAWQFWLTKPSPTHQMAVVARSEAETMLRFKAIRVAAETLKPEPGACS
jgi:4'-phosphopantetheinyl transferase